MITVVPLILILLETPFMTFIKQQHEYIIILWNNNFLGYLFVHFTFSYYFKVCLNITIYLDTILQLISTKSSLLRLRDYKNCSLKIKENAWVETRVSKKIQNT